MAPAARTATRGREAEVVVAKLPLDREAAAHAAGVAARAASQEEPEARRSRSSASSPALSLKRAF